VVASADAALPQLVVVEAVPEAYKEVARFKAVAGKCWSTPALSEPSLPRGRHLRESAV
jgi:hypothetical protein